MKKTRAHTHAERTHRRYPLEGRRGVRAQITHEALSIELLTLGLGGCAFWLSEKASSKLRVGQSISCRVAADSSNKHPHLDEVTFQAEILYSYPYPFVGELGKCFGIKFLEDSDKIHSLLDILDTLDEEIQQTSKS